MTVVLVHGNPETEAIWDDLVRHLRGQHVVRLSPPGFGSAIPPGFNCSIDAYRDWLEGELEKLAQPILPLSHFTFMVPSGSTAVTVPVHRWSAALRARVTR